ncbi:Putative nifZ protein (modular protein) [Rhizobium mesoamericanum STM3625]|nr:Putative nifZ protein (modular protein) [Rhizobium mesoamericanum STM3625]
MRRGLSGAAEDLRCRRTLNLIAGMVEGSCGGDLNAFIDILQLAKGGSVMGLGREQEVEIRKPPQFIPGERVRAILHVKNDGSYAGKNIGENLVRKGDEGYVRDIGTFLQQFYIYAVEWVGRGTVVGMRARELMSLDKAAASGAAETAAPNDKIATYT